MYVRERLHMLLTSIYTPSGIHRLTFNVSTQTQMPTAQIGTSKSIVSIHLAFVLSKALSEGGH